MVDTGVIVVVSWRSCWLFCWWLRGCHHRVAAVFRADGVVDAQRHLVELCGADGSECLNITPGHMPLVVYYQVAVLFNKWYVSN